MDARNMLEVCVPSSVPNETRPDETGDHSRMAVTGTGLLLYGPVARENSGKIRENSGRNGTTRYHSGKVLNGIEITIFA